MNKATTFGLCFMWMILITFLINSVYVFDSSSGITILNPVSDFSGLGDQSTLEKVLTLFRIYWGALTFSIQGLPTIFSLFFQIPTAIIAFLVTDFAIRFIRGS